MKTFCLYSMILQISTFYIWFTWLNVIVIQLPKRHSKMIHVHSPWLHHFIAWKKSQNKKRFCMSLLCQQVQKSALSYWAALDYQQGKQLKPGLASSTGNMWVSQNRGVGTGEKEKKRSMKGANTATLLSGDSIKTFYRHE